MGSSRIGRDGTNILVQALCAKVPQVCITVVTAEL